MSFKLYNAKFEPTDLLVDETKVDPRHQVFVVDEGLLLFKGELPLVIEPLKSALLLATHLAKFESRKVELPIVSLLVMTYFNIVILFFLVK